MISSSITSTVCKWPINRNGWRNFQTPNLSENVRLYDFSRFETFAALEKAARAECNMNNRFSAVRRLVTHLRFGLSNKQSTDETESSCLHNGQLTEFWYELFHSFYCIIWNKSYQKNIYWNFVIYNFSNIYFIKLTLTIFVWKTAFKINIQSRSNTYCQFCINIRHFPYVLHVWQNVYSIFILYWKFARVAQTWIKFSYFVVTFHWWLFFVVVFHHNKYTRSEKWNDTV